MITARALAPLLACALLAGACSTAPAASDEPELTGVRAVTVSAADTRYAAPLGMTVKDRDCGELTGPHYTLGVAWTATGQVLGGQDARQLGITGVPAPQGKQLTIVSIDLTRTTAPSSTKSPILVQAVVDGRTTPLAGLPLPDSSPLPVASKAKLVMISAPPNASLGLRVTDAGRSQQLDLRTGGVSGSLYTQRDSKIDDSSTATTSARATGARRSATTSAEATEPDHAAHEWIRDRYADLRETMSEQLADLLPADVDPGWARRVLLAVMDGLQVQWLLDPHVHMVADVRRLAEALTSTRA